MRQSGKDCVIWEKERKGTERKGKERKGKGREGKGREPQKQKHRIQISSERRK